MRWLGGISGHEFEQALGVGEGLGCPAYCSLRDRKESDMSERLNNNLREFILKRHSSFQGQTDT